MTKQIRRFGGKKYQWVSTDKTKANAKKSARLARSRGWNARIVKGKNYMGKVEYRTYESVAKSKRR